MKQEIIGKMLDEAEAHDIYIENEEEFGCSGDYQMLIGLEGFTIVEKPKWMRDLQTLNGDVLDAVIEGVNEKPIQVSWRMAGSMTSHAGPADYIIGDLFDYHSLTNYRVKKVTTRLYGSVVYWSRTDIGDQEINMGDFVSVVIEEVA